MTSYAATVEQMMAAGFVTPFAPAAIDGGMLVEYTHPSGGKCEGLMVKVQQGKAIVIVTVHGQLIPVRMSATRLTAVCRICSPAEAGLILRQLDGSFS